MWVGKSETQTKNAREQNGSITATILWPRLGLYPESSFSSSLSTETNGSDYSRASLTRITSRGYSRITSLVYHLRKFVGGGQEQDGSLKNDWIPSSMPISTDYMYKYIYLSQPCCLTGHTVLSGIQQGCDSCLFFYTCSLMWYILDHITFLRPFLEM